MRLSVGLGACLLAACATTPTASEIALNSCFWGDEQPGWVFSPIAPSGADKLRALIVARGHKDFSADPRYPTYWFSNADGRYSVCSIVVNVAPLPAVCARASYQFRPTDSGWEVVPDELVMCTGLRQ